MNISTRGASVALPSDAGIRAELACVIASSTFRTSPRLVSFLCFVVEATLAGHASGLKEYNIAIEALGRSDAFDPRTNPIVRVEAGRLRKALEHYYAGPGRHDQLMIGLPLGGYVPTFSRRKILHDLWRPVARALRVFPGTTPRRRQLAAAAIGIAAGASMVFGGGFLLARTVAPGACYQMANGETAKDAPVELESQVAHERR
jgi:hypothetical protein